MTEGRMIGMERIKRKHRKRYSILLNVFLLVLVFIMMIPFIWMISISLRHPSDAYRLPPSIFPDSFKTESYVMLFNSQISIETMYLNSIIMAVTIVIAQLITCPMAGYAFARLRFRWRKGLFSFFLISLMIPHQSIIIPLYVVMSKLHMMNSLLSVIVPCFFNAFGVFLFRQSFAPIPHSFEDAAAIDGAGIFRTYWQIMLPQVKATLVTLIILTFTYSWNMYFEPLVFLTKPEKMTLPVGLVYLKGYMNSGNLSVVMAAVTLAIIPILILFFFCQRFVVEGLTASGIKE